MTTSEERAYAAGLFDGEGCIRINKGRIASSANPIYSLSVQITQDDTAPLAFIRERWGGQVRPRRPRLNGKVASDWTAYTKMAGRFLVDVFPYLIVKRAEAEIAIRFQEAKYHPGPVGLPDALVEFFVRCRDDLDRAKHRREVTPC